MENKKFTLENFPKKEIYKVPDHYFEELSQNILSKTSQAKPQGKIIPLYQKYWYVGAACIAATILFFVNQNNEKTVINDLSEEEIVAYLDNQSINQNELSEAYKNHKSIEKEVQDVKNLHLSDDELLELMEIEGDI